MPRWPFKRRRNSNAQEQAYQPLSEKAQAPAVSSPPTAALQQRTSLVSKERKNRDSHLTSQQATHSPPAALDKDGDLEDALWVEGDVQSDSRIEKMEQLDLDKENRPVSQTWQSREDITALPNSMPLESSPHLRPVDLHKPAIPYNFRTQAGSQTSFHRQSSVQKPSRPGTLRSKRSTTEYSLPQRKLSSKVKKRDERLREENIRAMSAAIDIPRRGGDTPLRQDSRKARGLLAGTRESNVSLPPEGSIHSSMSGVLEQRGWEVGALAVFNPRPNVRLSGLPQYVAPQNIQPSTAGVLYRIDSIRAKDKRPVTRESVKTGKSAKSSKKRERIGDQADSLDSSNIRAIMDREAKRRDQKQRERQEKIDRKLRSRAGRDRKDSERRRRETDETRRTEEARARAEQELRSRAPLTPPTDIHPAFRNRAPETEEDQGLGLLPSSPTFFEPVQPPADTAVPEQQQQQVEQPEPEPVSPIDETNPFDDPPLEPGAAPEVSPVEDTFPKTPGETSHYDVDMETPMEEPTLETAQAVRMAHANTPPLSPVFSRGALVSHPSRRGLRNGESSAPSTPVEPPTTEAPAERKPNAWSMFFRRGGTNSRSKGSQLIRASTSFSNTSRESMRNQPLPAHLVESDSRRPSASRSISGPAHTQSRFREDLPEMPISPPDSRTQTPDVAIATATSARRANRPQPIDIPGSTSSPTSPATRGHLMSASLASVDSEGSWLASGSVKRHSTQSALSRSFSKRNAEFSGSYEELAGGTGDKDAEYFQSMRSNSSSRHSKALGTALAGDTPDEEMENAVESQAQVTDPLTIHESLRRQPLLVHRDPRFRSREGLLAEVSEAVTPATETPTPVTRNLAPQELAPPDHASYHGDSTSASEYFDAEDEQRSDFEEPFAEETPSPEEEHIEEPQLRSATSVRYVARHSRQFSAGSARLLDVTPRRISTDANADTVETPRGGRPPSSPRPF